MSTRPPKPPSGNDKEEPIKFSTRPTLFRQQQEELMQREAKTAKEPGAKTPPPLKRRRSISQTFSEVIGEIKQLAEKHSIDTRENAKKFLKALENFEKDPRVEQFKKTVENDEILRTNHLIAKYKDELLVKYPDLKKSSIFTPLKNFMKSKFSPTTPTSPDKRLKPTETQPMLPKSKPKNK